MGDDRTWDRKGVVKWFGEVNLICDSWHPSINIILFYIINSYFHQMRSATDTSVSEVHRLCNIKYLVTRPADRGKDILNDPIIDQSSDRSCMRFRMNLLEAGGVTVLFALHFQS